MCPALEPLYLDDFRISVVLPVYSETRTVRQIVDWLGTHLGARLLEVIIVISPRSSADSQAVCSDLAREDQRVRVFEQQENPGVGRAFREGYARVRGNVVLSMDSDGEMESIWDMGIGNRIAPFDSTFLFDSIDREHATTRISVALP